MFFWNSRPDCNPALHFCPVGYSFNPCFSGTRARTPIRSFSRPPLFSFNPCFSGTRARTVAPQFGVSPGSGFNPCFSGTRARTLAGLKVRATNPEFQSLFFWNSRPDLWQLGHFIGCATSFNPCFSGTRARTWGSAFSP